MKKILILKLLIFIIVKLNAQSFGGLTTGGSSYCDSLNTGFISLSNYTGTILGWEASVDNGSTWSPIANQTNQQSYYHIGLTTWYRAIVKDGAFPPDTSTISVVTIYPPAVGGLITGGGDFCLSAPSGTLNLTGEIGMIQYWQYSSDGGINWSILTNTTTSQTYSTITQNILYRAIVKNVLSCPTDTSNEVKFTVFQNTIPGTLLNSDTICYNSNLDTLKIVGQLGSVFGWLSTTSNPPSWNMIGHSDTLNYVYSNLTQSTSLAVLIKNGVCPMDTSTIAVLTVVHAAPVTAGEDKEITRYQSTTLDGNGIGSVEWNPSTGLSDNQIFNPIATPLSTTIYTITLTDRHQCISKDEVIVNVDVKIPTAITPNGDGVNDYFELDKIENFQNSSIMIFNRWGNLVYKSAPYSNNWNGKSLKGQDLPDEIYYYLIDYGVGEKPISGYVLIKR